MSALRGLKNSARSLCTPASLPQDVRERHALRTEPSTSSVRIPDDTRFERQRSPEESNDEGSSHMEDRGRGSRPYEDNDDPASDTQAEDAQASSEVNKVYKHVTKPPTENDFIRWLRKAENKKLEDFIMTAPPVRPKAGDVILYRCQHENDDDYRRDGYAGLQATYKNYNSQGDLMRVRFTLRKHNKKIPGFEKVAICLRKNAAKPDKIMLIWYYGDEKIWTASAHGNSKDPTRYFAPNTDRAKQLVRTVAETTGKTAMHVYRGALQQTAAEDEHFEERQVLVGPRDKKQVENIMHSMRKEKRVHEDEIMSVYVMGRTKMYGDFIREMKLLEKEVIILAETEMLNLAKALIREAADPAKKIPLCIGFDTTFHMTDGYVSALVMRNCFLEGDPIFAPVFLIHERRTTDVHKIFWDTMKTLLPIDDLPLTVPIVTDREAGLLKGMFASLGTPGMNFHHIPCSVHIKRDVKQWLIDNNAPSGDITALVGKIDTLVGALTEEQFEQKYNEMAETWSQPFVKYISEKIKSDLKRASYFFTSRFEAFRDKEATSNFIESLNNIMKHLSEWQELRIDCVVMNLFNMTMVYLTDFHRAYKNAGNHRPKAQFARRGPFFSLPPYAYWPEKKFLEKFKATYQPDKPEVEVQEAAVSSRKALARIACDLGYVVLNSQNLTFTVTHPYDHTKAIVEEDDGNRLTCSSCEGPGVCFHKEAYLHVTKKVLEGEKTKYKLSALRKRTRQPKGRSGMKKIRKVDVNDVVAAPDSIVAQRHDDEDTAENDDVNTQQNQQVSPVRSAAASMRPIDRNIEAVELPDSEVENEVEIEGHDYNDVIQDDKDSSEDDDNGENAMSSSSEANPEVLTLSLMLMGSCAVCAGAGFMYVHV